MSRVRFRFTKVGKIRWTSHRDLARMWERAFRRVELPLAYSEGFSPRPKISFGLALPTGHESVAEYLDVELAATVEPDLARLPAELSAALPVGVDVVAADVVPPGTPSLQEAVTSCTWRWSVARADAATTAIDAFNRAGGVGGPGAGGPGAGSSLRTALAARVAAVLAAPEVVVTRTRKGQPFTSDIRPAVLDLRLGDPLDDAGTGAEVGLGAREGGPEARGIWPEAPMVGPEVPEVGPEVPEVWLEAELACRPTSLRPSEVLAALDPSLEVRRARRTNQWILRDGARREPLVTAVPDVATDAPHAWGRAS